MVTPLALEQIDLQEQHFAAAFAAGDIALARHLYRPDVVYLSPTTRLFGREPRIEGVEATLSFIQTTIDGCADIEYRLDERAVLPGGTSAYCRILFDWDGGGERLRSCYVVVYRYRDGRIGQQELYYDPSGALERLGPARRGPARRG